MCRAGGSWASRGISPLAGKRRYNIKLWKTFTDCFNCLPIAAIVDEKIFCCHGGEGGSEARVEGMSGKQEPQATSQGSWFACHIFQKAPPPPPAPVLGRTHPHFGLGIVNVLCLLCSESSLVLEGRNLKRQKAMTSARLASWDSGREPGGGG